MTDGFETDGFGTDRLGTGEFEITEDFERRLIRAIQPVRHFFLARVVGFALASGLLELLDGPGAYSADEVAAKLGWRATERAGGLLRYLANEGVVRDLDGSPALTDTGRQFLEFRPWYELLIGGYADTLGQLPETMADPAVYAGRNGAMVGKGSCGMSRYDALPLVRRLLRELPGPVDTVVDLGCGDGTVLLELCGDGPSGVGVDPHPSSIAAARRAAAESGLDVSFAVDSAEGYLARGDGLPRGRTAYLTAFSLQEVLEQQGRDAVVQLVHAAVHSAEDSHVVVIEVDHRPDDPSKMRHGLGAAYYNPYYLLHQVTEQRLETTGFWRRLFSDAGARVEAWMTADPRVDSTALEFGCLLSRATEAPGGEGGDA